MQAANVESQPSLDQPHTFIFFIAGLISLAIAVLPQLFSKKDRSWERRVYWGGTAGAVLCISLASFPDWKLGIGASLFGTVWMVVTAYAYTPYIKIRGKIYAFHLSDSSADSASGDGLAPGRRDADYDPAPDSYGGIATATKTWWLLIPAVIICILCIAIRAGDKPWLMTPLAAIALVIIAGGYGYGDGSWGYPIARRQRLQFCIISIISVGTFTVLYLSGYQAGKRWPLRRKQSMEYQAHPRHQKKYP